jgi:hypothetical protein
MTDRYVDPFTAALRDELAKLPEGAAKQAVREYLRAVETTHETSLSQALQAAVKPQGVQP